MKSSEKKDKRFLTLLRGAFLEKEKLEVGNRWQENVMHRIRKMRNIEVAPGALMAFLQFAWKLAPVTVVLILTLTAFLMSSGLTPGYGIFEFGLEGPEELTQAEMVTP